MVAKLSLDHYLRQVSNKTMITLVSIDGKYIGSRTPITLKCEIDGHSWSSRFNLLSRPARGCAVCAKNKPISISDAEALVNDVGRDKFVSWDGAFIGMHSRAIVSCVNCGKERSAKLYSITRNGRRCHECTKGGFKSESNGCLYVLKSHCGTMVKFGISNNYKKRMYDLRTETPFGFDLVWMISGSGKFVMDLESIVLRETNQADFSDVFSGYAEWRKVDNDSIDVAGEFLGFFL